MIVQTNQKVTNQMDKSHGQEGSIEGGKGDSNDSDEEGPGVRAAMCSCELLGRLLPLHRTHPAVRIPMNGAIGRKPPNS